MASKKTASKPAAPAKTAKPAAAKPASDKPRASGSSPDKKGSSKPSSAKPAASKPATAKPSKTKPAAGGATATEKKAAPAKTDPKPKKPPAGVNSESERKAPPPKKPAPGKHAEKPADVAKPSPPKTSKESAPVPAKTGKGAPAAADDGDKKGPRKGITIVENRSRPAKKPGIETKFALPAPSLGALLAKRRRQPLIPSGPDAPPSPFGLYGEHDDNGAKAKKGKSPFKKKELDGFRAVLIAKRRELAGDVAEMERGMASQGDRGGDPALDVAEQGSDAYGQSLSIGLAEADRKLIREIDDALRRIDDGVYGLCEVTHEPIGIERLRELPWARLSIEAARSIERRGGVR